MKKVLAALLALGITTTHAHDPDFSKLPTDSIHRIDRYAGASNKGVEIARMGLGHGTMFKIGERFGKHYYATAKHLDKQVLPKTKDPTDQVYDIWYSDGQRLDVEAKDAENDVMILSTMHDFGDEPINVCNKKPSVGDMSYVFGYHRGYKGLGSGRIGDLESKIMGDKKNYYHSDTDILAGASGSPSLLYQNKKFCVYGMSLGNIDGGFFSASSDIEHTIKLYQKVLSGNK